MTHAQPDATDQMFDPGRRARRLFEKDALPLPDDLQKILMAMCKSSNYEVCGFIDASYGFHVVDNVHEKKTHNFLMDQDSFVSTIERIYSGTNSVLGIFHTHPNNVTWPTPRDLAGWPNPALKWRYWIVTSGEVIEWRLL